MKYVVKGQILRLLRQQDSLADFFFIFTWKFIDFTDVLRAVQEYFTYTMEIHVMVELNRIGFHGNLRPPVSRFDLIVV